MSEREELVMNLKKLLLISVLMVSLSGCATTDDEYHPNVGVYENPAGEALVCKIPLDIERVEPVQWRDYRWVVLNTERVKKMIDQGEDVRYYALSPTDFENQSLSIQEILRYVATQNEQIERMIEYYSVPNENSTVDTIE